MPLSSTMRLGISGLKAWRGGMEIFVQGPAVACAGWAGLDWAGVVWAGSENVTARVTNRARREAMFISHLRWWPRQVVWASQIRSLRRFYWWRGRWRWRRGGHRPW